jgi:hypothetical protein
MDSVLPFVVMHGPIRSHSRHRPNRRRTYFLEDRAHSPVQYFGSKPLPYVPDIPYAFQGIDPITAAYQAEKEDIGRKSRTELRYYDDKYTSPNDERGRSEVIVFIERAASRGTVRSHSLLDNDDGAERGRRVYLSCNTPMRA